MSLIATCPACATRFIVKPEQLAAHRGDVRCGECHTVFNALSQLSEAQAPQNPPAHTPAAPVDADDMPLSRSASPIPAEITPPQEMPPEGPQEPPLDAMPPQPERIAAPEPEPQAPPSPTHDAQPLPSFLQPKKTAPLWLTLPLVALLLLLAAAQTGYLLRQQIAARFPATKPFLQQLCVHLGCELKLPQRLDLIKIEDSDLKEDPAHQSVMILSCTLRNQGDIHIAYPTLVLTLNDLHDQALLRRNLPPTQYLPNPEIQEAGIAPGAEIPLQLPLQSGEAHADGYTLSLSY